ncbi:MAG: hypothetical protein FWG57_05940 [Endomicrobia bacterium]|nr:hypothetical protein [Endomicrobiia bacterium]
MKKLVFVLAAVLACSFAITACSSDKKTTDIPRITIEVIASTNAVVNSGSVTLDAVARDASNAIISPQPEFVWSLNTQTYGSLSSTTGSTVTFNAAAAGNGSVIVKVEALGVSTNTMITVGSSIPAENIIVFIRGYPWEGGLFDFYTWGGPAGAWNATTPWPQMPGAVDGVTRGVLEITWNNQWDGPTPVRSPALDATIYKTLVFYAKVASGTGDIVVRSLGNDAGTSTPFVQKGFSLTTVWTKCAIELPASRTSIVGIMCFVLASDQYPVAGKTAPSLPFTFLVDNVYFTSKTVAEVMLEP